MLTGIWQCLRWFGGKYWLWFLLALIAGFVVAEGPPPAALSTGVDRIVADDQFAFWNWEAEAIWVKFTHWLVQPQRYMSEPDRSDLVREYAILLSQAQNLRWQIEVIYADPAVSDPDAVAAALRAEWAQLRAQVESLQPVVESIIEEQVEVTLTEEGLGYLSQPFPPVGARFTPLPYLLIISPRDRIEAAYREHLVHGLDLAVQEDIEAQVDEAFDVSSLVTRIGGLSAWPAMLLESTNLPWVMEVTAHEWTHHYLEMYPLGWAYNDSNEARTINETTASIVGTEIGRAVLARYYPDLLPPPAEPESTPQEPAEPPAFDFRMEMHETRVEVDRLLGEGMVEEAEQYMEERRRFFWDNGYRIRKLNQAYFAFYGSYADEPGASGEDPTGPAVLRLRDQSSSLRSFLDRISTITSLEELQRALEAQE